MFHLNNNQNMLTFLKTMEFKDGFNPGQGNTYTEINLGPNSQYLPNVTTIIINNGVPDKRWREENLKNNAYVSSVQVKSLGAVKSNILDYVNCIASKLRPEKMNSWQKFWKGLLDVSIIEQQIGNISKQQGTTFNRMFVCNIIRYLDQKGFYEKDFNASEMARMLEGDDQHSIRTHGLDSCPDETVCKQIDNYIENFNL